MTPVPAPWRCAVRAVVWLQPVPARHGLTGDLARHQWAPIGLGGLVAYRDTPVGPYREVFTAVATLDGGRPVGHVPFMAVDSAPSVAGGRGNWALPKELVRFDGDAVRGDGWAAAIRATTRSARLPVTGATPGRQSWPDGALRDFLVRFTGRAGPARVRVGPTAGAPLPGWLAPGRFPAVAFDGTIDVLPPEPAPAAPSPWMTPMS